MSAGVTYVRAGASSDHGALSVVAACAAGTTSRTTTAATPRNLATIASSFGRAYAPLAGKTSNCHLRSSGVRTSVGATASRSRAVVRRIPRPPRSRARRTPRSARRARAARAQPCNLGIVGRVRRAAERVLQLRALLREPVGLEAQAGDLAACSRPGANRRAREAGERARVVDRGGCHPVEGRRPAAPRLLRPDRQRAARLPRAGARPRGRSRRTSRTIPAPNAKAQAQPQDRAA